jgi:peptidoglycan/xylan/chitin deacetylase (PgdA/CDA1 family)
MKFMNKINIVLSLVILLSACNNVGNTNAETPAESVQNKDSVVKTENTKERIPNDAAAILAKKQVPVLCYHHIRESQPGQSETYKTYSVSPSQFAAQMKALKDSGYETILPDQLYNYLVYNDELPAKPVMLTFDDSVEGPYTIGVPEMDKYGYKGVFFLMTISIGKPRYMTKDQIKDLVAKGHAIEAHTWDHHMVTKLKGDDFQKQFEGANKTIEDITGKKVTYFAYPFGIWGASVFPELEKAGYRMSFILSTKRDSINPLQTVRRMIVPAQWSTKGMFSAMNKTFQ